MFSFSSILMHVGYVVKGRPARSWTKLSKKSTKLLRNLLAFSVWTVLVGFALWENSSSGRTSEVVRAKHVCQLSSLRWCNFSVQLEKLQCFLHVTELKTLALCVVVTFQGPSTVSIHWHSLPWHSHHLTRITKIREMKQPFSPILVLKTWTLICFQGIWIAKLGFKVVRGSQLASEIS